MRRRNFLFLLLCSRNLFGGSDRFSIEAEVLEVFQSGDGHSLLLIHHAHTSARAEFADWLHTHSGEEVRCQARHGGILKGQVFRLKMCFGRGLLLTQGVLDASPKERVRIQPRGD